MRKGRPRYPHPKDIDLIWKAVHRFVPMDAPVDYGWRESINKNPNFRIQGVTKERNWTVDIYSGQFYLVSIENRLPEKCQSIPTLIGYLCRMLGVTVLTGTDPRSHEVP